MASISSVSFGANYKKENNKKRNVMGASMALLANTITSNVVSSVTKNVAMKKGAAIVDSLTKNEIDEMSKGVTKTLTESKVLSGKVQILPMVFDKMQPFFVPQTNAIHIDLKNNPTSGFHELGHAFNFNSSKIIKTMSKTGPFLLALAPVLTIIPALTKETKAQNGQELTNKEKFINGFRKACPFLAGALTLPTIIDEAMATRVGNDFAKGLLSSNALKKVKQVNKYGLLSYLGLAGAIVLSGFVAKKIKDASDKNLTIMANDNAKIQKEYHQG